MSVRKKCPRSGRLFKEISAGESGITAIGTPRVRYDDGNIEEHVYGVSRKKKAGKYYKRYRCSSSSSREMI